MKLYSASASRRILLIGFLLGWSRGPDFARQASHSGRHPGRQALSENGRGNQTRVDPRPEKGMSTWFCIFSAPRGSEGGCSRPSHSAQLAKHGLLSPGLAAKIPLPCRAERPDSGITQLVVQRPCSVDPGHSPIANEWLLEVYPALLIGAYRLRGSRIVNSLKSPTLLSTAMLPPCAFVTMS